MFPHRTEPRPWQLHEFRDHAEDRGRALWWEMGVGKTKPVIDTMALLAARREITCALVLAPGAVADNWVSEELPKHLHEDVASHSRAMLWQTSKAATKGHALQLAELLAFPGLRILAMTYDSLMTDAGAKAVKALIRGQRVLVVLDESSIIKNPGAKVTKRVMAMLAHPEFTHRRVLNGSLSYDSPFEAYSQCKAAQPSCWADIGIRNYTEFKGFFAEWEKRRLKTGREYPHLKRYLNLPAMHEVVHRVGSRLLKKDVLLDLPDKVYMKRTFDLDSETRRHYDSLVSEYRTFLNSGKEIEADLSIVRMVRLQQAASGYLPDDGGEPTTLACGRNPRVACFMDALAEMPEGAQAITWCKFTHDVDQVCAALAAAKVAHARFDGQVDAEGRAESLARFRSGDARIFVAKPSAAGRGLTLTEATYVFYYNNGFSLDMRMQSEDRAHRSGQKSAVTYVDVVARNTIDGYILSTLREKRSVSALVTGDQLSAWA